MTSETAVKVRLSITWSLRVLLGLTFLGIGIEKLTGTMGTIPFFEAIGWGQWFRYASGVLDTAGALLIFVPRWTSYGALIITCTVGLGTILCFTMALYNPMFPLHHPQPGSNAQKEHDRPMARRPQVDEA